VGCDFGCGIARVVAALGRECAASLHDQLVAIDSVFSFSSSAAIFVVVDSNTFFHANIVHII
jgi:hypothetical protein